MTEILASDQDGILRAASLLRAGKLVAFGTETVYGLGADATNGEAVAEIFVAKGRPRFNPLIIHFATAAEALAHVHADERAERLAEKFWPGPLTLVLKRRAGSPIDLLASAGLETMAIRVPAHETARALISAVGRPVAAPSANVSGGVSPTCADHVMRDFSGRIAAILESGPSQVGVESTVLDLSGPVPVLLRPGGVLPEALEAVLGKVLLQGVEGASEAGVNLKSPGLLASHYAPRLPVRLDAMRVEAQEALLAFGPPLPGAGLVWNLSERGELREAAARLFAGLRWLDERAPGLRLRCIAAMSVPQTGLGAAINDRLRRAAAPRA